MLNINQKQTNIVGEAVCDGQHKTKNLEYVKAKQNKTKWKKKQQEERQELTQSNKANQTFPCQVKHA